MADEPKALQRRPGTSMWAPSADQWQALKDMASTVVRSQIAPESYKTVEQVMVCFLHAGAMDVHPMLLLQNSLVVKGRIRVMTELLLSLAYERVPGFTFEVLENTDNVCEVAVSRQGQQRLVFKHTTQDARSGGYYKNAWPENPKDMNYYAATRKALRRIGATMSWMVAVQRDPTLGEHEPSGAEVVEEQTTETVVEPGAVERLADEAIESLITGAEDKASSRPAADPPEKGAPATDFQREFMRLARQEWGLPTRQSNIMKAVIVRLLTEPGLPPPAPRAANEVTSHEWRVAIERCAALRHEWVHSEQGHPKEVSFLDYVLGGGRRKEAEGIQATDGPPAADEVPADRPEPAAELPKRPPTHEWFLNYCQEAARKLGDGTVFAREAPKGSGRWYFGRRDVLESMGFEQPGTMRPVVSLSVGQMEQARSLIDALIEQRKAAKR